MKQFLSGVFTLLLFFSLSAVYAQQCGTTYETQALMLEKMTESREAYAQNGLAGQRDDINYIPIQFHLVGLSDSTLTANENSVLAMICNLNTYYADQDIVFYIQHPLNYIYNSSFYNNPNYFDNPAAQLMISGNKVNNAVNIFLTGQAGPNSAGFYQGPVTLDYIVIKKEYMTDVTAAHELGHFFSLAHPFFGWGQAGDTGWNPNVHGWQVGPTSPQGEPNEKVDMSNCTTAADQICDTPPDYLFASSPIHDGDCTWDHEVKDPNGDIIDPMENNIMSYFNGCNYSFTADQKQAILLNLMSNDRNYIRHSYVPNTTPITEAPELFFPVDGEITPGHTLVEFDWSSVPGATHYILEIDFLPTFSGQASRFIIDSGSTAEIEDIFNPNSNYYWRVRPYSDGYTCQTPYSANGNFKTGDGVTSTRVINEVNDWALIPNPVSNSQQLTIQVEASEAFRAGINLYSVTGQQLRSIENQMFAAGSTSYEMNISDLSPGIYVVAIQTNKGVVNKKVVITQ